MNDSYLNEMASKYKAKCPCKECTGVGLGWMRHLSKGELAARTRRIREEIRTGNLSNAK